MKQRSGRADDIRSRAGDEWKNRRRDDTRREIESGAEEREDECEVSADLEVLRMRQVKADYSKQQQRGRNEVQVVRDHPAPAEHRQRAGDLSARHDDERRAGDAANAECGTTESGDR